MGSEEKESESTELASETVKKTFKDQSVVGSNLAMSSKIKSIEAAEDIERRRSSVFAGVIFNIVEDTQLSGDVYLELRGKLLDGGAEEAPLVPSASNNEIMAIGSCNQNHKKTASSDNNEGSSLEKCGNGRMLIDVTKVTHIISNHIDFPEYSDADECMVNIVKPSWVLRSWKAGRAAPLRMFSSNPKFFFSDVNIVVAGLPQGDREAIYGGVRAMGGQWSESLSKLTTHVVALNTEEPKCRIALKRSIKVVLPHWIDDCLKLHRRVDDRPYLFPNPLILTDSNSRVRAMASSMNGSNNGEYRFIHPANVSNISDIPIPKTDIFPKKSFYLAPDLGLSGRFLETLTTIISSAGGSVIESLSKADVYIGMWREGDDYIAACRRRLIVGNLTWVYWMLAQDHWTSPLQRLLHYPLSRQPIEGMQDSIISVSGYTGEARHYLEQLIVASGAQFTRVLKTENTHLITARAAGEKYEAAREWNIHVVNHLWLEETYAKWEMQTVALPRYSHFPRMNNLMEVIGQTRLDIRELKRFYELEDDMVSTRVSTYASEQNENATPNKEQDCQLVTSPGPVSVLSNRKLVPISDNATKERQDLRDSKSIDQKETPRRARNTIMNSAKENTASPMTPVSSVLSAVTMASSSSRRAKEAAASRLREDVSDMNSFEKQKRRKGLPIHPSESSAKRVKTVDLIDDGDPMRILLTGFTGSLNDQDHEKLFRMGIEIVENPERATHIASPKISRTEKFLCAFARGLDVLSTNFLTDSIKRGVRMNIDKYKLHDMDGEKRNKCNLDQSISRARNMGSGPFMGITVNVTSGVKGGFDTINRIVQANGGECILVRSTRAKKYLSSDNHSLILVSSPEEREYFKPFQMYASKHDMQAYILSTEWILTGVLRMKITLDDEFSLAEDNE
ncbi:hypothetical protein V1511DRAFT_506194 [Dipodascopsis uninucleata]